MKALRILREQHGLAPDKAKRALARQPLSRDDYVALLEGNGFRVREHEIGPAPMTPRGVWAAAGVGEDGRRAPRGYDRSEASLCYARRRGLLGGYSAFAWHLFA